MDQTHSSRGLNPRDIIYNAERAASLILQGVMPTELRIPTIAPADIEGAWRGLAHFDSMYTREQQKRYEIEVLRDHMHQEPDDGIIRKSQKNGNLDNKIYLHYRPDLVNLLTEEGIVVESWQREWFNSCGRILKTCEASMLTLAREMDRLNPAYGLADRIMRFKGLHVLRVLLYDETTSSDDLTDSMLATTHTDRCSFTFNIASSRRGFVASNDGLLQQRECSVPGNVLVFTGDQFERLSGIKALPHGVVDVPGYLGRRWAIVCFFKTTNNA